MSKINDAIQLEALKKYLQEVKPFHTKILSVKNQYNFKDNIFTSVEDRNKFDIRWSNLWDYSFKGDGITTRFRIPATVIPRNSQSYSRFTFLGSDVETILTSDEDSPVEKHVLRIPFNNGIASIKVNGTLLTKDSEWSSLTTKRTLISFYTLPVSTDVITIDLYTMDQLYISIDYVWQTYTLEGFDYITEEFFPEYNDYNEGAFDLLPFEEVPYEGFEDSGSVLNNNVEFNDIGRIIRIPSASGKVYFAFEFFEAPSNGTLIKFKIIQDESSRNLVKTFISDSVTFKEVKRFNDNVKIKIREPVVDTYDGLPLETIGIEVNQHMFEINNAPSESEVSIAISDSVDFDIIDL